jgi:ProP effector
LQEQFAVFSECKPLAIGIDKQLIARLPDIDRKTLRVALGIHTHSLRYLKGMEKASNRYDLDNNAGDALNESHRTHATQALRDRAKKAAERRRAEETARKAEVARREEQEAERQRSQKLEQLAAKFSRRG